MDLHPRQLTQPTPSPSAPPDPPTTNFVSVTGITPKKRRGRKRKNSSPGSSKSAPSCWTTSEVHELLAALQEELSRSGEGSNFQKATWKKVSDKLTSNHPEKLKMPEACQSKWAKARHFFVEKIYSDPFLVKRKI
jgi:hypothetical protein